MSYIHIKSPIVSILTVFVFLIYCFPTFSAVKIKGGVITSAEILKTQKPEPRNDLIFNLNDFDKTHLEQKLTIEEAIRFENRIGFGAPYDRVKRYIGKTRKEAIDLVINELENYQDNFEWPNWKDNYIPTSFIEQGLERSKRSCRISSFRTDLEFKWSRAILSNKVPQFEKLALFWLDHFSVAFDEYNQTHSFVQHLEFIRKNSIGKFDDFLRQSIMDPAIIVYLNNEQSTTQKPNENLAREFLELFSLGEGNYSENEIKNLAKKLPGNGINHVSQNFQLFKYKISGQTLSAFGQDFQSADEFIDLVISHPAFGEFISKKFYNEFVDLNDPSAEDLAILVSTLRKYDFSIIKLLKATISLRKFWDNNNRLTLVKSPIELVYGTARTTGVQGWKKQNNLSWLLFLSKDFGQDLFNPPNIAGWPTGKEWLSGQFLEKRMSKLKTHFSYNNLMKTYKTETAIGNEINSKKIADEYEYNVGLEKFYSNTLKDQLAVETIVINWIPKDFETRKWAEINVGFYGVKLNDKFWDGINIRFGTDINSKKKQKYKHLNRVELHHGYSFPDIFKSWEGSWISSWNGHYSWNSSFPEGPRTQNFNAKSKSERLLLIRLLQTMEHLIDNETFSPYLDSNVYVKEWLKARISETKIKKWNLEDNIQNTKVYSLLYPAYDTQYKKFDCGPKRAGIDFAAVRSVGDNFRLLLSSKFLEDKNFSLNKLLLPDLDLGLNDEDFQSILSYEGYQLK